MARYHVTLVILLDTEVSITLLGEKGCLDFVREEE